METPNHYLNPALFKALEGTPAAVPGSPKSVTGPRGGRIKKISPTTGKPIYYKPWEAGQGYKSPALSNTSKKGHEVYGHGSVIGRTSNGLPVHAHEDDPEKYHERTKHFHWRDHVDAHQAHFSLAQSIKNMIMKRLLEGKDTSKLHGRYNAHMGFSKHHYKEALLNLVHDKEKPASQEDLSKEEGASDEK